MTNAAERIRARIAIAKEAARMDHPYESDFHATRIEALEDALAEVEADMLDEIAEAMKGEDMMPTTIPASQQF